MNSQIVAINQAVKSKNAFYLITGLIPLSLFLDSGFVSVAVIWFFVLAIYTYSVPLRGRKRNYCIVIFPIGFFALNALWMLFSGNLSMATDLLLRKVHLMLIPLAFLMVDKDVTEKQLQIILAVFLAACLLSSAICLFAGILNVIRFGSIVESGPNGPEYFLTYLKLTEPIDIPPIYLSMFCSWAFAIALRAPYLNFGFRMGMCLYLALFIMLLASTVGMVALAVVIMLWLQTTRYRIVSRYFGAVVVIIAMLAGHGRFNPGNDESRIKSGEMSGGLVSSVSSRLLIWSYACETIKQNPVIGYGLGGGQKALEETYQRNGFTWGVGQSLNAHNEFLSTLLDFGIPGFSVLTATLIFAVMTAIRHKDFLALCFIVMMIIFFFFESVLLRQKGIVFFSFFYAILFSHLAERSDKMPTV